MSADNPTVDLDQTPESFHQEYDMPLIDPVTGVVWLQEQQRESDRS